MKLKPFRFRELTTEEIGFEKANCSILIQDLLNQHIELANYSTSVKSITCFFIIRWSHDNLFKISYRFFKKEHNVRWTVRLNYPKILSASLEETTAIMAQTYLETIRPYFKKFKYDFEGEQFYQDVKQLFAEKGWVEEEPVLV